MFLRAWKIPTGSWQEYLPQDHVSRTWTWDGGWQSTHSHICQVSTLILAWYWPWIIQFYLHKLTWHKSPLYGGVCWATTGQERTSAKSSFKNFLILHRPLFTLAEWIFLSCTLILTVHAWLLILIKFLQGKTQFRLQGRWKKNYASMD